MSRIFLILVILFSSFSLSFAQDEDIDDEFFDDEPIIDPLDEPIAAPPTWEAEDQEGSSPRPGGSFPRPSGGGFSGAGGINPPIYSGQPGSLEFRLVQPPALKKPKPPIRIPMRIRKQVEENVKRETSQK
ncbi:MAG: hypothetical protein AABZ31_08410 [Bdellovibrionota bacterium]